MPLSGLRTLSTSTSLGWHSWAGTLGHELTVVFGLKACGLKPGGQVPLPPPGGLAREDEDLGGGPCRGHHTVSAAEGLGQEPGKVSGHERITRTCRLLLVLERRTRKDRLRGECPVRGGHRGLDCPGQFKEGERPTACT